MLRAVSKSEGKVLFALQRTLTIRLKRVAEKDPQLKFYSDRLQNDLTALIGIMSKFKVGDDIQV